MHFAWQFAAPAVIKQNQLVTVMQFIKRRENDPEYLKAVIAQKEIVIEQEKRKFEEVSKANAKLKKQCEELQKQKGAAQEAASHEITNLNAALQHLESEIELLNHQKHQTEFSLNSSKLRMQEIERQHTLELERIRADHDSQRELLNLKVDSLQKNLADLKRFYRLEEKIVEDKKKIIEDSNRDLKGFSNQKQERLMMIQNQQYKTEIEYQSKNITVQLEKSEKLQEEIKALKLDLRLHKEIENDLIKRSALAQTLIKKLYREMQQLRKDSQAATPPHTHAPNTQRDALTSSQSSQPQEQQSISKLRFELANLKNENNYLHSTQKVYSKKYETLGSLLADYLDALLYARESSSEGVQGASSDVVLNMHQLKARDVKEWKAAETEAVVHLLLTQLKPFLSKSSLVNFPQVKNVNISFVEEAPKELLSLPRIAQDYEKSYEREVKKGQNRFKDIPIDISTKILRSNLREWGAKVKYGNMPVLSKTKSKSNADQLQKSFL